MLDAINAALRFAKDRTRADLDRDEMLLFALVRAVEIVGEAASRVSEEARREVPDIPWSAAAGMRNRLVHAYYEIDRDILWSTVTEALPPLGERLRSLQLPD
jgi:uncharacterized protein with HEPN domain